MAGYRLIRVGDVCNRLASNARAQKAAQTFKEEDFVKQALTEIGKQHADAKAFSEESVTLVDTEYKSVEKAVTDIKKLLGRSRLTDAENKKVKELVKGVKASFDKVEEDDGALDAALKPQYREPGWRNAMKALLGEKNADFTEIEKEADKIDAEEKNKDKKIKSIEDWVKECDGLVEKAGKQADKDRAAEIAEISADLADAEKLMQKQAEGIDKLQGEAKKSVEALEKLGKKKAWTKSEAKEAQAAFTTVKGAATRMRGAFKTMNTQFDDLLERGMASPEAARKFKDRIQNAEKLVDSTEKRVDDYDKDADKYAALAKKIEKAAV